MFKLTVIKFFIFLNIIYITSSLNSSHSIGESLILKGVLGQKISLPCYINTEDCGDVYLIAWTKSDGHEESDNWPRVYVYSENLNKPLKNLVNRARFELDTRNGGYLIIDNLKYSDEANYKCDVTYIHGGKCPSITFLNLEILIPPSKATIREQDKVLRSESIVGPYKEGEELRLECMVIGGKPLPKLSWQQLINENVQTFDGINEYRKNSTSVKLIKKLSRSDLNSNFVCHIQHESIGSKQHYQFDEYVQLDLHVGPVSLEISGTTQDVLENDVVKIRCIAYGSRPHVNFEWLNGTRSINNLRAKEEIFQDKINGQGTKRTESTIEILVTRYDHLATIQCLAINSAMIEPLKKSIQLHVLFSPAVVMEPQNGLVLSEYAQSVDIYCTYQANPTELNLNSTRWFKNEQVLDFSDITYFPHFSGYPILSIINVTRKHSGAYSCEISNEIGKSQINAPLMLSVIYPPTVIFRIFPDASQGILIKEGDNIQLICDIVKGMPFNITKVKWIKTTGDGNDVIINETSQNEIVWMSVDRTLSANYSCMALNEAGWSGQSNLKELDIKHLPSQPVLRQINGDYPLKGDTLLLECMVEDLGKPEAHEFSWSQDGVPFNDIHGSILNVPNITVVNRGNYSCAAVNAAGAGPIGYFFVKPIAPPKFIEALPQFNGALFNASQHSVWCRIECDPICSIKWLENGSLIVPSENPRYFIKETQHPEEDEINAFISVVSTLNWNMSISLDRYNDNAEITCSSTSNVAGPGVESKMKFFVEYSPENLMVNPQTIEIIEGNIPSSIECQSTALPAPSYRWERFGVPISLTPILNFQSPISLNTSGNYTCVSFNRHGSARIDATIDVLHKPICEIFESQIKVDEDNIFSVLVCEALANPNSNLSFSWMFRNKSFTTLNNSDLVTVEKNKSKIVVSSIYQDMLGEWKCVVTNSIGISECSFIKSFQTVDSKWTMPILDDKSIILIAALIALLIIMFIIILIILICLMKRKRAKQEAQQMVVKNKKSDGSESSQSSLANNLSSNQVIHYKRDSSLRITKHDKVTDTTKKPQIQSNLTKIYQATDRDVAALPKEMYENIAFQSKSMLSAYKPNLILQYPNYQNIAQLTGRRVHSSKCYEQPSIGLEISTDMLYADVYQDLQVGKEIEGLALESSDGHQNELIKL